MAQRLKKGDRVEWHASQGTIEGEVERTLTQPTVIEGHHVAASADHPEILVTSDETGAEAAHLPAALKKTRSRRHG